MKRHTMLDGGDIYDCWNYYRMNVEDKKQTKREELWCLGYKTKTWKKKKYVSNAVYKTHITLISRSW